MPLELKQPDDQPEIVPSEQTGPPLTLADIEDMQTRCRQYIDGLVAEQCERYPGLPSGTLRNLLTRHQNDFIAAERLLKQES